MEKINGSTCINHKVVVGPNDKMQTARLACILEMNKIL